MSMGLEPPGIDDPEPGYEEKKDSRIKELTTEITRTILHEQERGSSDLINRVLRAIDPCAREIAAIVHHRTKPPQASPDDIYNELCKEWTEKPPGWEAMISEKAEFLGFSIAAAVRFKCVDDIRRHKSQLKRVEGAKVSGTLNGQAAVPDSVPDTLDDFDCHVVVEALTCWMLRSALTQLLKDYPAETKAFLMHVILKLPVKVVAGHLSVAPHRIATFLQTAKYHLRNLLPAPPRRPTGETE